jgi:hypothetical protein
MDRLITIQLEHYDRETEIAITIARSGIGQADAGIIVDLVRKLRTVGVSNSRPTIQPRSPGTAAPSCPRR